MRIRDRVTHNITGGLPRDQHSKAGPKAGSATGALKTPNAHRIPDDHSAVEPRLPFPNRTVKRRSADDSAGNYRVKVGHRQDPLLKPNPNRLGFLFDAHTT